MMMHESEPSKEALEEGLLHQFKQQMLKAWQPVPTLTKTIIMFFLLAIIFLALGIPMLVLSTNILQYSIRYDNVCTTYNTTCTLDFTVGAEMAGPVFVYYQLHNFYQNHRLYANSLSTDQLKGESISSSDAQDACSPIVYNRDLYVDVSITGAALDKDALANPCGMIAYTVFNDSFSLGGSVDISNQGIAWPTDLQKYQMPDKSVMWTNITDERFMNWMRVAAMPNFRKLWGRIEDALPAGTYTLTIDNNFDISAFGGEKYFVVSQSNFFGSKNQFLSITYIVAGGLCFLIGIGFTVRKVLKKSKTQ